MAKLDDKLVEGLKGKSADERKAFVRDNKYLIPRRGTPERDSFMQLANTGILPEEAASEEPATPPPAPETEPKTESQPEPKPADDDWDGYGSREEYKKAFQDTRGLVDSLSDQVRKLSDRINAEQGPLGRKVKELETQLTGKLSEIEKLREQLQSKGATEQADQITVGDIPEPPDPESFDDGVYDKGYKLALKEYHKGLGSLLKVSRDEAKQLRSEIAEVKTKATEAHGYIEQTQTTSRQKDVDASWDDLWAKTVPEIQSEFQLPTSVPYKKIDDANMVLLPNSGASEEQKATAKRYLESLPKRDLDNARKIVKIVANYCDFDHDDGYYPKPKAYANGIKSQAFKGHLIDAGIFSPGDVLKPEPTPHAEEMAARTQKQLELENGQKPIPGADLGAGDGLSSELSNEEAMEELRRLSADRKADPFAFQDNATKWARYCALRRRLGFKLEPKKV